LFGQTYPGIEIVTAERESSVLRIYNATVRVNQLLEIIVPSSRQSKEGYLSPAWSLEVACRHDYVMPSFDTAIFTVL
jgi:hypothetical protein